MCCAWSRTDDICQQCRGAERFQDSVPLGMCRAIWTPFSDEEEEGSYTNLVDKTTPTFFPWARGQPNGAHTENGVSIRWNPTSSPAFFDQNEFQGKEKSICSSCSLADDFSLTLWGACKDTLIGKIYPSHLFSSPDTIYVVSNRNKHIVYYGWTSSVIE